MKKVWKRWAEDALSPEDERASFARIILHLLNENKRLEDLLSDLSTKCNNILDEFKLQ